MRGLLGSEVVAFLQHAGVDPDHCLLDHPHGLYCHEVQHVLALLSHHGVYLRRVEEIYLVHGLIQLPEHHCVVTAHSHGQHFVEFEEIVEFTDDSLFPEHVLVVLRHVDEAQVVEKVATEGFLHEQELIVCVGLSADEVSDGLVEVVLEALMAEFAGVVLYLPNDVLNVGFELVGLDDGELVGSALGYLQEGVAGHFHDAGVFLLHELEQFLDNSFEEGPVVPEEGGVLPDDIHDAGGNDGLVLLALLDFAELEEGPEGGDEEGPLFPFLDAPAERAHNPGQGVQGIKVEILVLVLFLYLLQDELLHLRPVVAHQELAQLLLNLVEGSVFCVLHLLPHWSPVFIDHDQHLLGLCHLQTHHLHHLPEDLLVNLVQAGALRTVAEPPEGGLAPAVRLEDVCDIEMEEVDGDLEHLFLFDFHHHQQIPKAMVAHPDGLIIPRNRRFQPGMLALEEL